MKILSSCLRGTGVSKDKVKSARAPTMFELVYALIFVIFAP